MTMVGFFDLKSDQVYCANAQLSAENAKLVVCGYLGIAASGHSQPWVRVQ